MPPRPAGPWMWNRSATTSPASRGAPGAAALGGGSEMAAASRMNESAESPALGSALFSSSGRGEGRFVGMSEELECPRAKWEALELHIVGVPALPSQGRSEAMEAGWIEVFAAAAALAGCAGRVEGATPSDTAAPSTLATSATTPPVMLDGRVVDSDGAPLPGVDVVRLALDPYLVPVLHAGSDATGSFVLGPVSGDSREWLTFQMPGHVNLYEAFDTAGEARQTMPAALLP